jgi:hypothetical protein
VITNGAECRTEINLDSRTRWSTITVYAPTVRAPLAAWPAKPTVRLWTKVWYVDGGTWKVFKEQSQDSTFLSIGLDGKAYMALPNVQLQIPSALWGRKFAAQTAVALYGSKGYVGQTNYLDENATTYFRQNRPIGMGNYSWDNWMSGSGCEF